jgi:hypothetical protein
MRLSRQPEVMLKTLISAHKLRSVQHALLLFFIPSTFFTEFICAAEFKNHGMIYRYYIDFIQDFVCFNRVIWY